MCHFHCNILLIFTQRNNDLIPWEGGQSDKIKRSSDDTESLHCQSELWNHLPSSQNHWGVRSVPHRKQNLQEKVVAWNSHLLAPGEVCCPASCLLRVMELVQIPFLTSVSNHSAQVSRLPKVWLFIYCDFLENSAGGVSPRCFTMSLWELGRKEIPTLHLSLGQASLPTRWSL